MERTRKPNQENPLKSAQFPKSASVFKTCNQAAAGRKALAQTGDNGAR
jgi:hypothetical protein